MKRRNFLQGIAATAGAAALPLPTTAKVATGAATKVIPFHYGWACVYAQMNNGIAAADISRVFGIPVTDAQGLMTRMLDRGVIYPAGLDGRSRPTRAWQPWDKKQTIARQKERRAANGEEKPAATADTVIPFYFGWACVFVRKNTGASAADISRVFNIPQIDADALVEQMSQRGIIEPLDTNGRSRPIQPWDDKKAMA